MTNFVHEINAIQRNVYPVQLAALAHLHLLNIYPFVNGPIARLLMNLFLVNRGYRVMSIQEAFRRDYMESLQAAQQKKTQVKSHLFAIYRPVRD
jgi:Fic family protein